MKYADVAALTSEDDSINSSESSEAELRFKLIISADERVRAMDSPYYADMQDDQYYNMQILNQYITLIRSKVSDDIWIGNIHDYRQLFNADDINLDMTENLSTGEDLSAKTTLILPIETENGRPVIAEPSILTTKHVCVLVIKKTTKVIKLMDSDPTKLSAVQRRSCFDF